jgi:hypothetical protein
VVLDVVPEDPQEQHVPGDVQDPGVEEGRDDHRSEERDETSLGDLDDQLCGELDAVRAAVGQLTRDRCLLEEEAIEGGTTRRYGLPEERDDVRNDEPYSYDREPPGWVRVGYRDQRQHVSSIGR